MWVFQRCIEIMTRTKVDVTGRREDVSLGGGNDSPDKGEDTKPETRILTHFKRNIMAFVLVNGENGKFIKGKVIYEEGETEPRREHQVNYNIRH